MTTLAQPDLPRDNGVLQTIARHNRFDIPGLGPSSCVGVYALVDRGRYRAARRSGRDHVTTEYVRNQPDFFAVGPASAPAAIDMGHGIWCSPGMSSSYLVTTDDGRVVVNTGMWFEAQDAQAQLRRGDHRADALHRAHAEPHRSHRRHRPFPRRRNAARSRRRTSPRARPTTCASTACASGGRCRSSPT